MTSDHISWVGCQKYSCKYYFLRFCHLSIRNTSKNVFLEMLGFLEDIFLKEIVEKEPYFDSTEVP
jgi:hypothetical protein